MPLRDYGPYNALSAFRGAQKRWQKLSGSKRLDELVTDVKFVDGIQEYRKASCDFPHNL